MYSAESIHEPYVDYMRWLDITEPAYISDKQREAEALFHQIGITFQVYGDKDSAERLIPIDMIPRVFTSMELNVLERGVKQRAQAINAFLWDVYHRGNFIKAGKIPVHLVYQNKACEPAVVGVQSAQGIFSHIVGTDLVRTGPDEFYALEDNCRTPSGVSYMLENREIMKRLFPQLFKYNHIRPVDDYPDQLRRTLNCVAPPKCEADPTIVILTR